jgi:hypothetical protein
MRACPNTDASGHYRMQATASKRPAVPALVELRLEGRSNA